LTGSRPEQNPATFDLGKRLLDKQSRSMPEAANSEEWELVTSSCSSTATTNHLTTSAPRICRPERLHDPATVAALEHVGRDPKRLNAEPAAADFPSHARERRGPRQVIRTRSPGPLPQSELSSLDASGELGGSIKKCPVCGAFLLSFSGRVAPTDVTVLS
jgi:hypothetical protein